MASGTQGIDANEFLGSMDGATIDRAETDGHDIYVRMTDGRVFIFMSYGGAIVCGQGRVMDATLQ